jgi:hypothetical protein
MTNVNQMSDQMGISKGKANSLMKTAKKMNGYQGGGSAAPSSGMSRLSRSKPMGYADGGMARIQGTPPAQVKGFTFNDNDGKGTF